MCLGGVRTQAGNSDFYLSATTDREKVRMVLLGNHAKPFSSLLFFLPFLWTPFFSLPFPSLYNLMEIAIRKATRLEYRPPKSKHLQSIYCNEWLEATKWTALLTHPSLSLLYNSTHQLDLSQTGADRWNPCDTGKKRPGKLLDCKYRVVRMGTPEVYY